MRTSLCPPGSFSFKRLSVDNYRSILIIPSTYNVFPRFSIHISSREYNYAQALKWKMRNFYPLKWEDGDPSSRREVQTEERRIKEKNFRKMNK